MAGSTIVDEIEETNAADRQAVLRIVDDVAESLRRLRLLHPSYSDEDTVTIATVTNRAIAFRRSIDDGYTVGEAASISGLKETTIRHLLSDGKWPSVKHAGRTRIPRFVLRGNGEVPGIREICVEAHRAGWDVYTLARFLLTPRDWIEYDGESILDKLLTEGNPFVPSVLEMVGPRV